MTADAAPARYQLVHFDQVEPTDCPCGVARRAFLYKPEQIASLHIVETDGTARTSTDARRNSIISWKAPAK